MHIDIIRRKYALLTIDYRGPVTFGYHQHSFPYKTRGSKAENLCIFLF